MMKHYKLAPALLALFVFGALSTTTNVVANVDTPTIAQKDSTAKKSTKRKSVTVYITETGKKYHSDGCSSLRKSQIAISLAEARESYDPCSKCNPPE